MIKPVHYDDNEVYITKDGSSIRELMHPGKHTCKNQSLAEAIVPVGTETRLHKHTASEEIYYITQGKGLMTLDETSLQVKPGDTICIAPGSTHKIRNTGNNELKILCCCAPAYAHDDTILLDQQTSD